MVCYVADSYILYSYSSCIPDCPLHMIMQGRLRITDCMEKGKYIYIHMYNVRIELGITLCMHSLRVLAHAKRAILPISITWLFHQLL